MLGVDEAEIKAALDEIRAAYAGGEGPARWTRIWTRPSRPGILTQEEADAVRQAVEQGMTSPGPR